MPSSALNQCPVCFGTQLEPLLDLGRQPLCDDLIPIGSPQVAPYYETQILLCLTCFTALQAYPLPAERLFPRSYHYRARFTQDVLSGMRSLVTETKKHFGDLTGKTVLDVGCNDGSLLSYFSHEGAITTGIEPTEAAQDAIQNGHSVQQSYFTPESVTAYLRTHPQPDFITFTNVFAHIENLDATITSLQMLLHPKTVIAIENHYLMAVFANNQFDTFYHEHPRTYSRTSFEYIAERLGLAINGIQFPGRYGGNIRVFMSRGSLDFNEKAPPETKSDLLMKSSRLREFADTWKLRGREEIARLTDRGIVIGKSFPARASVLLTLLGVDTNSIISVYEKPGSMKIGNYVPGTRIPILSDDDLPLRNKNIRLLILGWHIEKEIAHYVRDLGFAGSMYSIMPAVASVG